MAGDVPCLLYPGAGTKTLTLAHMWAAGPLEYPVVFKAQTCETDAITGTICIYSKLTSLQYPLATLGVHVSLWSQLPEVAVSLYRMLLLPLETLESP